MVVINHFVKFVPLIEITGEILIISVVNVMRIIGMAALVV